VSPKTYKCSGTFIIKDGRYTFFKEKIVAGRYLIQDLILWRLEIPAVTLKCLECTSQRTRRNANQQERREADKMATMRKRRSRLSEYPERCKQNVGRTAHCSGGIFKLEHIVRPHRTKGKFSAYGYVVPLTTFADKIAINTASWPPKHSSTSVILRKTQGTHFWNSSFRPCIPVRQQSIPNYLPNEEVFPRRYYSTNAQYSFIYLSPTLFNLSIHPENLTSLITLSR
jgi:hypothetical protein